MPQEDRIFLNLTGEFAVASELNRRRILASVTYGASKSFDIFAANRDMTRIVRIEVKTTEKRKWPIGSKATELTVLRCCLGACASARASCYPNATRCK